MSNQPHKSLLRKLTTWPSGREKIGRWVLFATTPVLILGWLFPILMCLMFAARWKSLRFEPTLVLTAVWKDWAAERWGYSTTLLRGIVYTERARNDSKEADTRIERHEHVHIRQLEDMTLTGLFLGLVSLFFPPATQWLALCVLAPLALVVQWVTAWLRGGDPYRDSELERSAYAQTDLPRKLNTSWQEERERQLAEAKAPDASRVAD
ncbi:MAG: hypothetical protein ACPGVG_08595 [Mycobacterium sp.]